MGLTTLLALVAPPLCAGCGGHAPGGRVLCAGCARELRWLGPEPLARGALRVWAPLAYEGPAAAVARALKYRGALRLADGMAAAVAANAPPDVLASGTLVPVPLHPVRRRRRGFNQAERLGRALAQRTGLDLSDCLERRGGRGTQVGRSRADRDAAIEGAVRVRTGARAPRVAVLVDDVATTGATLEACARALLAEGADEVRAVAYARTPGR
ncbi:MAG: ComF family protein [Thermoleophilaceae bacterium]